MEDMKQRYIYNQNNSGGHFDSPKWTGPEDQGGIFNEFVEDFHGRIEGTHDVWVMAESTSEANTLAEKFAGVYFDGVDSANDCPCCGDRWYRSHGPETDEDE
jgi:hypothetical protein